MKRQIKRLSPHQNGKVLAVLTAIGTFPMFALTALPVFYMRSQFDHMGSQIEFPFPTFLFLIMPIFYFVFTYLSIVFVCWLYNLMFKVIGGFEFEFKEDVYTFKQSEEESTSVESDQDLEPAEV